MQEIIYFPDNYCAYLNEAFETRNLRNPTYSKRAFARDLDIGVSTLSEMLKGKYGPSKNRVIQIAKVLQLSDEQAQHFSDLVQKEYARNIEDREAARIKVQARISRSAETITIDSFKVVSEWYYLALLELIILPDFQNDSKWIAKRLGISEFAVEEAIDRLERLNLIIKKENGIETTDDFSAVGNNTPSIAIRKFHRQILEKAIIALDIQNINERECSSTVFAINKEDLPLAKKKIIQFRREFSGFFSERSNKNSVYCLGMQFFNLLDR